MYNLISKNVAMLCLFLFVCVSTLSAQSIKENELKVSVDKISNSTEQLKKLEPVTFKYDVEKFKHLKLPAGNQYGFLASNVQPEFPNMVYEASKIYTSGKNSSKVAKYSEVQTENLIPVLVAAIKEQQAQIDLLTKEVNLLKGKR